MSTDCTEDDRSRPRSQSASGMYVLMLDGNDALKTNELERRGSGDGCRSQDSYAGQDRI
jgi:hypothetical protein